MLDDDESTKRHLAKAAFEVATNAIAEQAEKFAFRAREIDGETALLEFARSIRDTNAKMFPAEGRC